MAVPHVASSGITMGEIGGDGEKRDKGEEADLYV
jgi:hypothetical protein